MKNKICPRCGGSGWESFEKDGFPMARRCPCREAHFAARRLAEAAIPPRYEHCELVNFECEGNQNLTAVRQQMFQYLHQYPWEGRGLLLMGRPGVGKTHLSVGILRRLIEEKGARGIFADFRDLLQRIRNTYRKGALETEERVMQPILDADIVLLDDVGAEKPSDWVQDILFYLLGERHRNMGPVLITTNYFDSRTKPDEELLEDRIGGRLRSRLFEMCETIQVVGPDYRVPARRRAHST